MDEKGKIEEMVENNSLSTIMQVLKEYNTTADILDELNTDTVLQIIDDDDMIDYLHGTYAMNRYVEDRIEEWQDAHEEEEEATSRPLINPYIGVNENDELWKHMCDILDVQYTNALELKNKIRELMKKLNKCVYNGDNVDFTNNEE